jgi:hypothetical protein
MRLRARLAKLERSGLMGGGCPACRHRRGTPVSVFSEENVDGTRTEPGGMPAPCARCGEIPEQIYHFIEVVVASRAGPPENAAGTAVNALSE